TRSRISSAERALEIRTRRRSFSPIPRVCWRMRMIPEWDLPCLRNSTRNRAKSPTLWVSSNQAVFGAISQMLGIVGPCKVGGLRGEHLETPRLERPHQPGVRAVVVEVKLEAH